MDKENQWRLKWYRYIVDGLQKLVDENKLPEEQQVLVEQTYGYMMQALEEQKLRQVEV